MIKSLSRQVLILGVCVWLSMSVIGCGQKVDGKYTDPTGVMTVEFNSGKATVTAMTGTSPAADYTVDGNKVTVNAAGQQYVFTINSDGTLTGPGGLTLKKVGS